MKYEVVVRTLYLYYYDCFKGEHTHLLSADSELFWRPSIPERLLVASRHLCLALFVLVHDGPKFVQLLSMNKVTKGRLLLPVRA